LSHRILPVTAATREVIFAEEIQDHRQITTPLAVIVNQQNFRFTPHIFDLILGANGSAAVEHDNCAGNWPLVKSIFRK
jgi:hypothetical protein